jgi:MarR family transcriptional regulator, organic hydroperoxide resistance regulator
MGFDDCICFRLGKAVRKVTKAYREEIASYGLTHGQFFMMVAIMEEDGLLPSELADKTAQDRATTTGLLDRLEKEGWIERKPDKIDRRSLRIYLTKNSIKYKAPILKLFEDTNRKFLSRFTPEEWDQMQSFLNRLEQQQPITHLEE